MALTRPAALERRDARTAQAALSAAPEGAPRHTVTGQRARRSGLAHAYAALAPTVEVALRTVRLESALSDPGDAANPYGFHALTARTGRDIRRDIGWDVDGDEGPLRDLVRAELLPAAAGGEFTSADQLVRVLRPLLRRDLALGCAYGAGGLLDALAAGTPAPDGARDLAALLGPATLIATTGTVLRAAVRVVADRGHTDPALRRWRAPLAAAFADLLACESLVTVALRSTALAPGSSPAVRSAIGYAVPLLVGGVLDELDLVLGDCGLAPAAQQRRLLAGLVADLPLAGAGPADTAAAQAEVVRELPALAEAFERRWAAAGSVLLSLGRDLPARSMPPVPGIEDTLTAAPSAAHARLTRVAGAGDGDGEDTATGALARLAGHLVSEQRALLGPCRAAAQASPCAPETRALADRQALLLAAGAALGVQGAADDGRDLFLGRAHWALLAVDRIAGRLGIAPDGLAGTGGAPAVTEAERRVWGELDARDRRGIDCDVYATRLLW